MPPLDNGWRAGLVGRLRGELGLPVDSRSALDDGTFEKFERVYVGRKRSLKIGLHRPRSSRRPHRKSRRSSDGRSPEQEEPW